MAVSSELRLRLSERFKWNEAALNGGGGGLGSVGDTELAEQAVDVSFDGGLGDIEERSDLLVAAAVDDLFEDVEFAGCEFFGPHALGEPLGDGWGNMRFSRVYGADR